MGNHKITLTWLGHNCFIFEFSSVKFLVDPFLVEGIAPVKVSEVKADYILVSHGHADHCGNALEIAQQNHATIVAIAEVAGFFGKRGVKTEPCNIGGALYLPVSADPNVPKAQILVTPAPHSSTMPDGTPGGNSVGFVLSFSQNDAHLEPSKSEIKPLRNTLNDASAFSVYFACDTGYFTEMNWLGDLGLNLAVLPIGDRYVMGPGLSLDAINALRPDYVVPAHYNTWPPIAQDSERWSDAVRQYAKAMPLVLEVGKSVTYKDGEWR